MLTTFPRAVAYEQFTPLERLQNLSQSCGAARLYVKRDDCNGLAFGGNKVRQLEYYIGDAIAQGADTVLITGAVQSNFVRMTAAFAARKGLQCHIQLESRVSSVDENYKTSGNVLLNRLLGAKLHYFESGEDEADADARIREIAQDLKAEGRKPYVIPLAPGHKPLGALGYVRAAVEILEQIQAQNLEIDELAVASGSGNTHAGLLFGLRALNSRIKVVGACVRRSEELQFERIRNRCDEIAELLTFNPEISDDDIVLSDEFLAPGYGMASAEVWKSIMLAASTEGLILDPTYSGKAMAEFLKRAQMAGADSGLMFVHTGGSPSLFAYQNDLDKVLKESAE